jgi:hypothetical protein
MLVNFNRAQNNNFQAALVNFGIKILVNIVVSTTGKVIDYINSAFEKSIIANVQQDQGNNTTNSTDDNSSSALPLVCVGDDKDRSSQDDGILL